MHRAKSAGLGLALGFAASAMLAMPAHAQRVSQEYWDWGFAGSEVGYASGRGPVAVYVKGDVFARDRNSQAILGVMGRSSAARELRFVSAPAPSTTGYSIIFVSGPLLGNVNYCAGGDFPLAPATGGLQISGIFCLPGRLRSQATMTVAAPDITSPQALAGITLLTASLLSPDLDPSRRRGGRTGGD
jgi:hypothetical protein